MTTVTRERGRGVRCAPTSWACRVTVGAIASAAGAALAVTDAAAPAAPAAMVARIDRTESTARDAIELVAGGLVIGGIRVEAVAGDRAWYRHGERRGSVPLAGVRRIRFAALPELEEAERRAAAGDPRGAAALLERTARGGEGPAADWAARRSIAWLGPLDAAAAATIAGERLRRDGDGTWLDRLHDATRRPTDGAIVIASETGPDAAVASDRAVPWIDVAAARALVRRVGRWRGLAAAESGRVAGGLAPVGVRDEVGRGLEALEQWADRVLAVARRRGDPPDRRGAGGVAGNGRWRTPGASGPAAAPLVFGSADEVARTLAAGDVVAVLEGLRSPGSPDPATFGPRLLRSLADAAEDVGRPATAAAAWLRLAVLHPSATETEGAWTALIRLHEEELGDPAAAARIRARRDAGGRIAAGRLDPARESRG